MDEEGKKNSIFARRLILGISFALGQIYLIRNLGVWSAFDDDVKCTIVLISILGDVLYAYFSIIFTGDSKKVADMTEGPRISKALNIIINILLFALLIIPLFIGFIALLILSGIKGPEFRSQLKKTRSDSMDMFRGIRNWPVRIQWAAIIVTVLLYLINFAFLIPIEVLTMIKNVADLAIAFFLLGVVLKGVVSFEKPERP